MVRAFTKFDGSGTRTGKRVRAPFANRGHVVSAPVGPTVYLYDTFDGIDGANIQSRSMNVGPGWVNQTTISSITLSGGRATRVGLDGEVVAQSGVSDGVITCDVEAPITKKTAGIAFRVGAARFGYWYTFDAFAGKLLKYAGNDGDSDIFTTVGTSVNTSATATITITLNGSSITIACTATPTIITYTDTSYVTNTKHGLTCGHTSVFWDNFRFASA